MVGTKLFVLKHDENFRESLGEGIRENHWMLTFPQNFLQKGKTCEQHAKRYHLWKYFYDVKYLQIFAKILDFGKIVFAKICVKQDQNFRENVNIWMIFLSSRYFVKIPEISYFRKNKIKTAVAGLYSVKRKGMSFYKKNNSGWQGWIWQCPSVTTTECGRPFSAPTQGSAGQPVSKLIKDKGIEN
jgi:hypothetical protein